MPTIHHLCRERETARAIRPERQSHSLSLHIANTAVRQPPNQRIESSHSTSWRQRVVYLPVIDAVGLRVPMMTATPAAAVVVRDADGDFADA